MGRKRCVVEILALFGKGVFLTPSVKTALDSQIQQMRKSKKLICNFL